MAKDVKRNFELLSNLFSSSIHFRVKLACSEWVVWLTPVSNTTAVFPVCLPHVLALIQPVNHKTDMMPHGKIPKEKKIISLQALRSERVQSGGDPLSSSQVSFSCKSNDSSFQEKRKYQ